MIDFEKAQFGNVKRKGSFQRQTDTWARVRVYLRDNGTIQVAVTLYRKALERMRWRPGDRVNVAMHKGYIAMRLSDAGYKLSKASKSGNSCTSIISFVPSYEFNSEFGTHDCGDKEIVVQGSVFAVTAK